MLTHHTMPSVDAGTRATAIAYGNQLASKGRQILSHIPTQYNPPAIPSKMQVFGYMSSASDECGRVTVAAVAPPAAIIMGVTQGASKGETVGPGQYSQEELFRNGNTLNFNTSKTERALFEPLKTSDNTMAPLSNPGPGYYEAKKASWEGGAGGGSSFKSETKVSGGHTLRTHISQHLFTSPTPLFTHVYGTAAPVVHTCVWRGDPLVHSCACPLVHTCTRMADGASAVHFP